MQFGLAAYGEQLKLLIKQGERSNQVRDIQARLRALGYDIEDKSGDFGPSTLRAVRAFQQARGVLIDGIVGPDTWNELVEASWRLGDRILYIRYPLMRGDDVSALQARLNALGFDAGREDGIFGPDTDHAVRAFQREYGIAEDGMFGPASLAALIGLRIDRPGTAAFLREELRIAEHPGLHNALVMIDPGHGGDDPGERGRLGATEAEVCWDIGWRLAQRLTSFGAHVRFTRTEAEGPDQTTRARRANEIEADVFISIHLNAHDERTADGASTYYFRTSRAGERLAELIQRALVDLDIRDCRAHPRSYAVLRETRMPAVLVEPCFITNPETEQQLEGPVFKAAIADALAVALHHYYERVTV
jgi:N-acetylmuramoyl-L-alanine amidase